MSLTTVRRRAPPAGGLALRKQDMRRWRWKIAAGPGDFLPVVIGCALLFLSVPTFVMLLVAPDQHSGVIGKPLLVILGAGILLGLAFLVLGAQLLSVPGSLVYRLAHGRFFGR
jgi:hypothetical protein